ncbi:MAG: hypothetical protein K2J39_03370, partial [Ruminococcus sp.]|nr:hypothetical protein [Ruminococcus sp.]
MTYIMTIWFISEIIMFIIMNIFIHLYITQSVELDIRSSLTRQVTSLSDNIVNDNGVLSVDESKIEKKYSDMYIVIIDDKGNIIWGSVPDGVRIDKKRAFAPVKAMTGKTSYYYIDRNINIYNNGVVRAYVSEKDILNNYIPVRLISFGGMTIIFIILTLVMLYALKKFRNSIKNIETTVAEIGTSQLSDKHMEESGHYKEINSLIKANNRMLAR